MICFHKLDKIYVQGTGGEVALGCIIDPYGFDPICLDGPICHTGSELLKKALYLYEGLLSTSYLKKIYIYFGASLP